MKSIILLILFFFLGLNYSCKKEDDNISSSGGNVPISIAEHDQEFARIISDGLGNVIIVWSDMYIQAQKMNKTITPLWNSNGVVVTSADNMQKRSVICPDGSGGVLIVWEDYRNGGSNTDIYVQKLNSSGNPVWLGNGVSVNNSTGNQIEPAIISDGSGGAIIAWQSGDIDGGTADVYVQKVNQDGIIQWTTDGIPMSTATDSKFAAKLTSDGNGGAIITWIDRQNGETDIYAQRVNLNGEIQWEPNGVIICSAAGDQWYPDIISDGQDGAIIVWDDINNSDIYAQRIDNNGTVQWTSNGIPIVQADRGQEGHQIISDGLGNIIIVWTDYRNGIDNNIYAQKINNSGTTLWASNGVVICDDIDDQRSPCLTSDGEGGAFIAWEVYRNYYDIYAQRVNSDGIIQWTENGVVICNENETQWDPKIESVGNYNGAIIVWTDFRNVDNVNGRDIFADYISAEGIKR